MSHDDKDIRPFLPPVGKRLTLPGAPLCRFCNDTGSIAIRSRDGVYAFPGPVPDDAKGYADADCWHCDCASPPRGALVYEAPRDPAEVLRVRGVGRVADEPRAILVMLTERPTDDEVRALHDYLRAWSGGEDER